MSSFNVTLYRTDDQRILKVGFVSNYEKSHEYYMLSFKCETETVAVISTSTGSIDGEGNIKITDPKAELFIDYCEFASELECLVGYYQNNELLDYETLTANFDNTQTIKDSEIVISHLITIPGSFDERFSDFFSSLSERKSSWNIEISCPDDVLLDVASKSDIPTMVSFGENTKDILSSDYVFRLDPNNHKINLPIEVIKKYSSEYSPKCQLGVFEIIRPDFLGTQGAYYKCLISNLITLSDISKSRL